MNPVMPLRIFIPLLLLISSMVIALVNLFYMLPQAERNVENESLHDVRQLMNVLQSSVNIMLRRNDNEGIRIQLTSLATDNHTKVAILTDEDGNILFTAHKQQRNKTIRDVSSHLMSDDSFLLTGRAESNVYLSDDKNSVRSYYPVVLPNEDNSLRLNRLGYLIYERDITLRKQVEIETVQRQVSVFLLLMLFLSGLLWLIFHILITSRVNQLLNVTNKVASGDFFEKSNLQGDDEFAHIGNALDVMSRALHTQQADLLLSENRLRQSQIYANMGSWEWRIKSGKLFWSETVAPMFGIEINNDELSYEVFISCVHPDDRNLIEQGIEDCLEKRETYDVDHRIVWPDGSIHWMHETGNVERDELGNPLRMFGIVSDITLRKQFEAQLKDSIEALNFQKYALDQHSIVVVTDLSGKITYANDKFTEISGYNNDELIGNTHRIVNSGTHSKEFFHDMWKTISAGKLWQGEICNRKKSGDLYWVDTTIVPHLDGHGKPDHFTAIRTDITERVLARKEILAERELLEIINTIQSHFLKDSNPLPGFENLLDALLKVTKSEYGFVGEVLYTKDGKPYLKTMALTNIAWNEETQKLYEDNINSGLEFTNLNTLFGEVLKTGDPLISNEPHADIRRGGLPHGHPELNSFMGIPLYTGNLFVGIAGIANRPDGYSEDMLDRLKPLFTTCARIIESYRAEQLRKSAENELASFKSTLDKTLDCVFIFEPDTFKLIYVNQGAIEQVGYDHDTLMEMSALDIKPQINEQQFRELVAPLMNGDKLTITFETVHQHKDGHLVPVENFLQYIDLPGEMPRFVAIVRDISERQQLQRQLQQAQKMESIGQLTGGIAHDFNNMLASIMGYTELASDQLDRSDNEKIKGYLSEVYKSGSRARDLVEQMLAFSRGGEGELKQLLLSPLIKESLKMLGNTLPSSIEIKLAIDKSDLAVKTNPVQFHQLIMNLCINARDAMQGKGNITIGLREATYIKNECFSCHEIVNGEFVEVFVSDTGAGIDLLELDKIFEPFFTTKDIGKGTGMGLSIVHGIMHDHGGHIIIDTNPKGTTFKLLFPIDKSRGSQANPDLEEVELIKNIKLSGSILVVDDEKSVGQFISELLRGCGCDVTLETDSRVALRRFEEDPEAFDLFVVDQTMPKLTGAEFATCILKVKPDLPIVLYTGYSDQIDEVKAKQLGIKGYINKPINSYRFLNLVKNLL